MDRRGSGPERGPEWTRGRGCGLSVHTCRRRGQMPPRVAGEFARVARHRQAIQSVDAVILCGIGPRRPGASPKSGGAGVKVEPVRPIQWMEQPAKRLPGALRCPVRRPAPLRGPVADPPPVSAAVTRRRRDRTEGLVMNEKDYGPWDD